MRPAIYGLSRQVVFRDKANKHHLVRTQLGNDEIYDFSQMSSVSWARYHCSGNFIGHKRCMIYQPIVA